MIHGILNSNNQEANLANVYTFLWCIWKARNNVLFNRKQRRTHQIYEEASSIVQKSPLEQEHDAEQQDYDTTAIMQPVLNE